MTVFFTDIPVHVRLYPFQVWYNNLNNNIKKCMYLVIDQRTASTIIFLSARPGRLDYLWDRP